MQDHGESGGPFDEGADGGAVKPDDEIALPVAGDSPVVRFGWPLTDEDLVADKALPMSAGAGPRDAECTTGAQASGELSTQSTSALDKQSLLDRLVRNPH